MVGMVDLRCLFVYCAGWLWVVLYELLMVTVI